LDVYDIRPDLTKELLKTKKSGPGTRREYRRMVEERAISIVEDSAPLNTIPEEKHEHLPTMFTVDETIKIQEAKPKVKTFPFVDETVPRSAGAERALPSEEFPGEKHGAKLCMISAMVHMRVAANRRAKSIRELRKRPVTSLEDKGRRIRIAIDEEDRGISPASNDVKNCRYLRGVMGERELTIDEIFG